MEDQSPNGRSVSLSNIQNEIKKEKLTRLLFPITVQRLLC